MSARPDALQRLRGAHEKAVLDELRQHGALSRRALMSRVGLSRTTVLDIVSELLERGAVVERSAGTDRPRGRGRPASDIALNSRGAALIGVDIRRSRMHLVVANLAHEIIGRSTVPLRGSDSPKERLAAAIEALGALARSEGISLAPIRSIGLGLPGYVADPAAAPPRRMTESAATIANGLSARFGVPVRTDNNARLAAFAEVAWGAARGHENAVYVRWSEGVGGGVVSDGRLVRGAHGVAGEIGHVSIDPDGAPCHCGGYGCLEGVVSVSALLAACAERGVRPADGAELFARAEAGEEPARSLVQEAAVEVGRVLAALAAQTDPECIVVDGEPAALDGLVLTTVREQIARLSLPGAGRDITVTASALGEDAAAQGAVALLLRAGRPWTGEPLDEAAAAAPASTEGFAGEASAGAAAGVGPDEDGGELLAPQGGSVPTGGHR